MPKLSNPRGNCGKVASLRDSVLSGAEQFPCATAYRDIAHLMPPPLRLRFPDRSRDQDIRRAAPLRRSMPLLNPSLGRARIHGGR